MPDRAVCHLGPEASGTRLSSVFRGTDAHRAMEGQPDYVFPDEGMATLVAMEAIGFLSTEARGGWAAGTSHYEDTGTFRWLSCERDADRVALLGEIGLLAQYAQERGLMRDFAWGCIRGTVTEDDLAGVIRAPAGTTSIRSRNLPADYRAYLQSSGSETIVYQVQHPPLTPLGRTLF
jgi:hypothetical protein